MVLRRRKAKVRGSTSSLSVNVSSNNEKNDNSPAAPETLSDEAKRNMTNRLSRIVGHLQSIKRMIEGDRDIESTLVQASAVRAAVNGLCKELLKELKVRDDFEESVKHMYDDNSDGDEYFDARSELLGA